ncbi:transcriptional activator SPT7, partial [Phenoliferia sp. Uapishka_3]
MYPARVLLQEHSTAFLQKVKKTEVPDYFDIIKKPMDLGTLLKRVKSQMYRSKKAFADDLDQIWTNALLYNSHPAHPLRVSAEILRKKANQLLEFISDPALPTRPIFAAALGNNVRAKTGTPDGDEDAFLDGDSEDEDGGLKGSIGVNGRVHELQNGHGRDSTDSPMASRSQTPVIGDRATQRKARGPLGRGRSRSASAAPEQSFEDRPAIIRTAQGMQDFALLDDELERLDATLGWSSIASTSTLGLPVFTSTPNHTLNPLLSAPIVSSSLLTPTPSISTPNAASPAPPPPPQSAEQARLSSLVKSLNPAASTPVAVPKADLPPDALWWETLAMASSSALGMPRCSFANHVEGEMGIANLTTKKNLKGKGKAKAVGTGVAKKRQKASANGGEGRTKRSAKGVTKVKVKQQVTGVEQEKGLGARMRRNFDTLQQIRRLHGKLISGARGPDDPYELNVAVSSDSDEDETLQGASSSFLDTGIPPEAFATHAAEQAGRESLGIVSNRVLCHAGFDGASATAVNVLAHVAAEYIMNLGRTMRFYVDRYGSQMSTEQILLHVLGENGVPAPSHLEDYVSEDIDRYGVKLVDLHSKLQRARQDQLDNVKDVVPLLDEQVFAEDSEMLQLDEPLSSQTGDDFFGLVAVGLDKELSVTKLAVPPRLFRGDTTLPLNAANTYVLSDSFLSTH